MQEMIRVRQNNKHHDLYMTFLHDLEKKTVLEYLPQPMI